MSPPPKRSLRDGNLKKLAFLLSGLWTLSFSLFHPVHAFFWGKCWAAALRTRPHAPEGGPRVLGACLRGSPRVLGRSASVSSSPRVLGIDRKGLGMYCGLGCCFFGLQTKGETKGEGHLQHSRSIFSGFEKLCNTRELPFP